MRQHFEVQNAARDQAIAQARTLTRLCANTIRAIHRHEWQEAEAQLQGTRQAAEQIRALLADHPSLYHAGYTQDALKEFAEAHLVYALVQGSALPDPEALQVPPSTYIGGLAEAATELRRHILDLLRLDAQADAERLLDAMDAVYSLLITMDFPEAITDGLRRRTDAVRGVLERTRGDLTLSLRQQRLERALHAVAGRLAGLEPTSDENPG
ncbi:MAG: haloacid dehalogenase [Anaerolineae bacterium]|nr:haloacid dehalogenase [Anaerolineae bacterium]